VGVSVLFLAQGQVCSYWLTRHRRFQAIASSSVVRSLGIAALQLVCGFLANGGLGAAIGATIAGQGLAVAYLSWRARDAREREASDPTLHEVASRYRKMALVGVPNVVVDAVRTSAIPVLIATYSVASLGQFNVAWLALQAPVALIAGALSQVYLPRLSDTPPGAMTRVVVRVGGIALACSIPVFSLLAWISPALFPFVFGARWEAAGYFARSLAPWLSLTVATSPLSNVFVATYHQRRMLAFACVYCAAPLAWLACSPYGVETTVAVLGALMTVLLVGMLVMAVLTARAYDGERLQAA
ncbi:polysaccharide biosynthesis protein, partial [Actinomyces sp. ICM58]|uniref:oligosaccharide flippase family protein n=1 Tax=Actinomyces sp. ICM58 TaxID=1105030 RepID=UPI0002772633